MLAVLRVLGLFDRPADGGCLDALRQTPAIEGLTEPLIALDPDAWNITCRRLEQLGLLSVVPTDSGASSSSPSLDAHPLIREYFAAQLKPDSAPPAGLHQQTCDDVYTDRILRGAGPDGYYSTKKLGVFGADLGAVACFFDRPWSRLSPNLPPADQAWLLNAAAHRLRALGRLTDAVEPMRTGLAMRVEQEVWKSASIIAGNLSELELTLGDVSAAVTDGEQSVTFADRSGDEFERMIKRTTHADALHQASRGSGFQPEQSSVRGTWPGLPAAAEAGPRSQLEGRASGCGEEDPRRGVPGEPGFARVRLH
jgi:hypothetical protein